MTNSTEQRQETKRPGILAVWGMLLLVLGAVRLLGAVFGRHPAGTQVAVEGGIAVVMLIGGVLLYREYMRR